MRYSLVLAAGAQLSLAAISPRNFIFVVPDGMSPYSPTIARFYNAYMDGGDWEEEAPSMRPLATDDLHVGTIDTYAANRAVTDSAAAGTAFAAGYRTNNGYLSVTPEGQAVGTVLEAAKMKGFKTGLVVTSEINHATPAAFSSHTMARGLADAITDQMIGRTHPLNQSVDLMYGGGSCYFRPNSSENSCREDDTDIFEWVAENGYNVSVDRAGFEQSKMAQLPILGVYADNHMAYDIDRQQQPEDEREPSLTEMTEAALDHLSRATACNVSCSTPGFFLMVESSRIDHAGHGHDDAASLHDVLEYVRTVEYVKNWIDEHPDTAMIAVADHETGGLTIPSGFDPRPLVNVTHSAEYLSASMLENADGDNATFISEQVLPQYGLSNHTDEELDDLVATLPLLDENSYAFSNALGDLLANRTGAAWSTGGHTAGDVILLAYAAGEMGNQMKLDLAGAHANTDLPKYIAQSLDVDVDEVTRQLQALGTDWIPRDEEEDE